MIQDIISRQRLIAGGSCVGHTFEELQSCACQCETTDQRHPNVADTATLLHSDGIVRRAS